MRPITATYCRAPAYRALRYIRLCSTSPPAPPSSPFKPSSASSTSSTSSASPNPQPQPPLPPRSDKDRLLDAILLHVPTHGFSDAAVARAVSDLSWSPAAAALLTPPAAVALLVTRFNAALPPALAAHDAAAFSPADAGDDHADGGGEAAHARAARAIRTRVEMAAPYRGAWAGALRLQATAPAVAAMTSAELADEVAHYAGYRAPNFSWYTDRSVLAGAFHATELFWVADRSPGQEETWRFLGEGLRRADDVRGGTEKIVGKAAGLADAGLATIGTLLRAGRRSY